MAPPRKRALPKPLPEGFILTDTEKKKWKLGKIIGQGGFGLIYLASRDVERPVAADTAFVIKVEYHENGPLFSELKFYQRAAKAENMQKWKKSRKLDFLGIPTYWGSGLAEHNDLRYRFMAMDRLGRDLQKVCEDNGGRLKKATVLQLGQGLVDVLEYIHENEYVHADIKAANLMLGYSDPEQVYLADYGLSYRYCPEGQHKEYKENPKKGHNGTIEYTSIDAHKGVAPSRRSDLQILGFCLLHWSCGSLPWDNVLDKPLKVQEAKARLMDHLPGSVQQLSVSGASTDEVAELLQYVGTLNYQDKPDYQYLKDVLASPVTGRLDFSVPPGPAGGSAAKVQDPPNKEKRAGRAKGASKAKARPKEEEKEEDEEEEEEEEKTKPKPVAARNRRGPPISKPQVQQKEDESEGRWLRPRRVVNYDEDSSEEDEEEEEEEEEEEARPKPIPACYLRGPPIGPKTQSKQKTKSKWASRKTEDLSITSDRQERRQHPHLQSDHTHMEYRKRWDDRLLHHRAGYSPGDWLDSDVWADNRDRCREWSRSALGGPQQDTGPTLGNGLFSQFVFAGVFLFLGAVLGVSIFKGPIL